MKKIIFIILPALMLSCTVTIPMQTNLSDQTMLLAENRNIKVNYAIFSNVPDGFIPFISVMKDGSETVMNESHKYASETAFKKLWSSYFTSKFNNYSRDEMVVEVTLQGIELRQQSSTSLGYTMLTGSMQYNVEAIAFVHALVTYKGETFENSFEVNTSDFNETQTSSIGGTTYTTTHTNQTQQKAQLLDNCLNKTIIQFENFLRFVMMNFE